MKKSFTMKSIAITLAALTLLPAAGMVGAEQVDDTAYSDISAPNYAEDTVAEEAPADDQISEIEDNAGADEMVYPVDEGIADDEVTGTSDIEETTDPECESMANDEVTGTSAVEETTDPECESMTNDEVTGTSAVEETTDPETESIANDEETGTSAVEETTDIPDETTDENTTDEDVIPVTITFDTDGGSEIESITDIPGTPVTIPEDPVKEGFIFNGWDTEIPEIMPEADMTIKALWEEDEETKERKFWENLIAETDEYIANADDVALPAGPYTIEQSNRIGSVGFVCCALQSDFSISQETKEEYLDPVFEKLIDLDNALIDDLADMLPAGHTLTLPFKWMVGALDGQYHGDDCTDKKERMIKELGDKMDSQHSETMSRLDIIDNKLYEISGQISETTSKIDSLADKADKLSAQMDKDATWVSVMTQNTTKLTECNRILNDIDSKVFGIDGLYNEIAVIENSEELNPQQKLVCIAVLNRDPRMIALRSDLDDLTKKMHNSNTALTTNYFDLIKLYNYQNAMFSRDADAETVDCANSIAQEYLAAMLVALRTMNAEKAVSEFTVEDCMKLTTVYSDDWMDCKKNSITLVGKGNSKGKLNILMESFAKAFTGYYEFMNEDKDTNYFINNGKEKIFFGAENSLINPSGDVTLEDGKKYAASQIKEITDNGIISTASLNALVNYVRTNKPGMTLREYLVLQNVPFVADTTSGKVYILLSDSYTETKQQENRRIRYGYDIVTNHYLNVKAVDIDDNTLTVKEVPFITISERPGLGINSKPNFSYNYWVSFNALRFTDGESVKPTNTALFIGDAFYPCPYGSDPLKGAVKWTGN